MPRRRAASAGSPFSEPATTYITTKLSLEEVAGVHAGKKHASLSTLMRRHTEEDWEGKRREFWRLVNAEVQKHTGVGQAEREAAQLRAVQSNAIILSALGGLVGQEIQKLQPRLAAGQISETRAALLLRTLASTARSISASHVALIAAERTLMSDGDGLTRELFTAFGEAHDAYLAQRAKVIAEREAGTEAVESKALVHGNGKHTNGGTP